MGIFWVIVVAVVLFIAYRMVRGSRSSRKNTCAENTPYKGILKGGSGVDLKYEVSVREKTPSEERASELLKKATQLKDEQDIDGAVSCLREAYDLIDQSPIIYPTKTFLRLPLYLQQGGRYSEAVEEFTKLLNNASERIVGEFSHTSKKEQMGLLAIDRSIIFDKMRLAAQREQEYLCAAQFQILSEANTAVGLKLQDREEPCDYESSLELSDRVKKLLKKADKGNLCSEVTIAYADFIKLRTNEALKRLEGEIEKILEISAQISLNESPSDADKEDTASNSTLAQDVSEIVFNFTQRSFIGEDNLGEIDLSYENALFESLASESLNQTETYQLSKPVRRLPKELLSQYIIFLEMNNHLSFPPEFLQGSSKDELGTSLLAYICHYKWPFPQQLPK